MFEGVTLTKGPKNKEIDDMHKDLHSIDDSESRK